MMLEAVGLFSKAGRVALVRYPALKMKEQMLSGVMPTVSADQLGLPGRVKAKMHASQQEIERIVALAVEGDDRDVRKSKEPEMSTSFTSQSRVAREKAAARRDQIPPVGAYNCTFALVEKRVLTPNLNERPKSQSRRQRAETPDHMQSTTYQSRHIQSPIPFKKQTTRPNITSLSNGVNEGRFVSFNDMPLIITKYKRVSTPDLGKTRARTSRVSKGFEPTFNTYNACYRLVQEDLGKVGVGFQKQRERQPNVASQIHDLSYEKVNYAQVERRVTSPEFYRASSRPEPSESPLPFFMRKIKSRASLNTLMDKGLEMNHFGDLRVESMSASPQKHKSVQHSPRHSIASSPSPKKMRSLNYSVGI